MYNTYLFYKCMSLFVAMDLKISVFLSLMLCSLHGQLLPPSPSVGTDMVIFKPPNVSDIMATTDALRVVQNQTLKYILTQDMLYCPYEPLCETRPRVAYSIPGLLSCCVSCSCGADCVIMGTCCPDVKFNSSNLNDTDTDSLYDCIHTQFLEYHTSSMDHNKQYLMISRCADKSDDNTVRLCEQTELVHDGVTLDQILPLTINETTYKNRHCAACNGAGIENGTMWTGQILCPNATGVTANSSTNLLRAMMKERACNMMYYPIGFKPMLTSCNKGVLRKCNVTGKWKTYDALIEKSCESYTHVYRGVYRNVFCFLCNEEGEDDLYMRCTNHDFAGNQQIKFGAFIALLKYSQQNEGIDNTTGTVSQEGCNPQQQYDTLQVRNYGRSQSMFKKCKSCVVPINKHLFGINMIKVMI